MMTWNDWLGGRADVFHKLGDSQGHRSRFVSATKCEC